MLVFPQENLQNEFSFVLIQKKIVIFFSSENAIILKSYYMQYSKQGHKIRRPPMKVLLLFVVLTK